MRMFRVCLFVIVALFCGVTATYAQATAAKSVVTKTFTEYEKVKTAAFQQYEAAKAAAWKEYDTAKSDRLRKIREVNQKQALTEFRQSDKEACLSYLVAETLGDFKELERLEKSSLPAKAYAAKMKAFYVQAEKEDKPAYAKYEEKDRAAYKVYEAADAAAYKEYQQFKK